MTSRSDLKPRLSILVSLAKMTIAAYDERITGRIQKQRMSTVENSHRRLHSLRICRARVNE